MSYVRTYNGNINVSGSVSVRYPASDHGGVTTARYSENVPLVFNVTVDTQQFDQSIGNAKGCVDALTGSVVAMNSAQCAVIKEATAKVSDSLTKGFFNAISSDITLKRSENSSELQSKMALLIALSKDIENAHKRMENDIERLRAHYGAIFRSLDSDLDKRIRELDKSSFKLGESIREGILYRQYRTLGASTVDGISSNGKTIGMISMARLKNNIAKVIDEISESLKKGYSYRAAMDETLWNEDTKDVTYEYVPVAYFICQNIANDQMSDNYYISPIGNNDLMLNNVREYVRSNKEKSCNIPEDEMNLIDQAFSGMVEESANNFEKETVEYDKRVYAEMLRMWHHDRNIIKQI